MKDFKNVIVWGHKLGSHTNSFVFHSFYRAFQYMGYNTYHFDNNDINKLSSFDFSNSLFLTEGQADQNIPIRKDCKYILHNCDLLKYISNGIHYVMIQVMCKDAVGEKINNYTYFHDGKLLFQPWATDLLPNEIVKNNFKKENLIYYIGTVNRSGWNNAFIDCENFARAASTKNIDFIILGGYSDRIMSDYIISSGGFIENDKAIKLLKASYFAPIFQGSEQKKIEYVPCRLFKNISYGQVALTNCAFLEHFFEEEPIIYNSDTYQLFFDAEEKKTKQNLELLMKIVKEKHTFVNRINQILEVL